MLAAVRGFIKKNLDAIFLVSENKMQVCVWSNASRLRPKMQMGPLRKIMKVYTSCRYSLRDNQSHPTQKSGSKSELILTRYRLSSGGEENGPVSSRSCAIEGFTNFPRASPANLIKQILFPYIFNLPLCLSVTNTSSRYDSNMH